MPTARKLVKNKCEIFGCLVNDEELLHLHHIIERTQIGTNNKPHNLAILCPNHHTMVHTGKLTILGVVSATIQPNNRILVYILDGVKNIDIEVPMYTQANNKFTI